MKIYARADVQFTRLVNPDQRSLEVLRLTGNRQLTLGVYTDDDGVRAESFDAFELELAVLCADPSL